MQAGFLPSLTPALLSCLAASCLCCLRHPYALALTTADLLLNSPGAWPPYVRGKGEYQWVLSPRSLRNSITYQGANERLRVALERWKRGDGLSIATVGGSITAGQGCRDAPSYPQYVQNYLQDYYGDSVTLANGAVPGTVSAYMSLCHNAHIPRTSDIIIVEYNQNDGFVMPPFLNDARRSYERLLRKLLSYPRKPAVILMHSYSWHFPDSKPGTFWGSAEADHDILAHYYKLPTLSVKTCCYQLMQEGVTGFWVNVTRNMDRDVLAEKAFYLDKIHPDARTGARVMAELAIHFIEATLHSLNAQPVDEGDRAVVELPLPAPMIPDNHHSLHDQCFMGHAFTSIVTKSEGFEWINESKTARSKWGMVATQVWSVLELTVDTQASTHSTQVHDGGGADSTTDEQAEQPHDMLVELAYLRSYEHMGTADVQCVSGCTCEPALLEGHIQEHTSQLHLLSLLVTQHERCVVQVQVRPETSSGSHKVKIAACIVSEEAGWKAGIQNHRAVEYVHDISFNSKDNNFDVRNHAKRRQRRLLQRARWKVRRGVHTQP